MSLVSTSILLSTLSLIQSVSSTTEWFGDLRAHMNPPRAPAFYDVTYDDSDCVGGLRADAIPDYVYFGTMVATFIVDQHDECLRKCLEKPKCKSVNFFFPLANQQKGFCELLSETQRDNPKLMRPFRKGVHYERIRCHESAAVAFEDLTDDVVVSSSSTASPAAAAVSTTTSATSATTTSKSSTSTAASSEKRPEQPKQETKSDPKIEATLLKSESLLLKRLAAKLAEYNKKPTLHAGETPFRA